MTRLADVTDTNLMLPVRNVAVSVPLIPLDNQYMTTVLTQIC